MAKQESVKPKPFPAIVCQRIRNLQAHISAAQKQRGKAFKARDHLKAQIADLSTGDPSAEHLKAQRNDIIDQIDSLNIAIKWGQDELKQTIEDADSPGLFDSPELDLPDFGAELVERAKKQAEKADDSGDGEDGDDAAETDDPNQLELAGDDSTDSDEKPEAAAPAAAEPPAEPAGDDEVIASLVPGRFKDQNAREYLIGDRAALEELINTRCGSKWFWRPVVSAEFGKSIVVRQEPGEKAPVIFTLRRVGDIDTEVPAKPKAGKKQSKKKTRGKSAAK